MSKLLKATAVVGVSTAVNIAVGLVRAKFTALTLGPQGVGIFSQVSLFLNFVLAFGTLGMRSGIARYISKYWSEGDKVKIEQVIYSVILFQISVSSLLIFSIIIFSNKVSLFLFSTDIYDNELILVAFGIPFMILVGVFEDILCGFGKYGVFTRARIIGSITGLIPLFILILLWGLKGGLVFFLINSLILFVISIYFILPNIPIKIRLELNLKWLMEKLGEMRSLIRYGGVSLVTSVVGILSILLLRSLIIKNMGAEANGIYQVVFAISGYYFPFFTNGVWSYFYPRMSGLSSDKDIGVEINNTIRLLVLIITPAIALLLIFKKVVIILIFSREFLPAQELFGGQLIGDFFFLLFYVLYTSLMARARLKAFMCLGIGFNLLFIFLFLVLNRSMGLQAITTAFALSHFIFFLLSWYYHKKDISLTIEHRNIVLIFLSLILISIDAFIPNNSYYMIAGKLFLIPLWFLVVTSDDERWKAREFLMINSRAGLERVFKGV